MYLADGLTGYPRVAHGLRVTNGGRFVTFEVRLRTGMWSGGYRCRSAGEAVLGLDHRAELSIHEPRHA